MSLAGKYNDVLFTEFLIEGLKGGTVPNLDEIQVRVDALHAANPLLGEKPLISLEDHSVVYFENASAAKWNDTLQSELRDLTAMYAVLDEMSELTNSQARRWSSYYESTRRTLSKLEDRIDTLLLLKRDTLGYFAYVSDDFLDLSLVDTAATTAKVETASGVVTMRESTLTGSLSRIPVDNMTAVKQVLSVNGMVADETPTGMGVANVLTDEYTQWLQVIRAESQGVVTTSVRVNLGSLTTVSKVVYTPFGSTASSAFGISLLYSQNGVDFVLVPGQPVVSVLSTPATWLFPEIQATVLRFVISKSGYDDIDVNNNYAYEFGCKNISVYNPAFSVETSSVLISSALEVLDSNGVAKDFSKAAIHTCDFSPAGTELLYFLSIDGSTYIPISSLDDESPSHAQLIDFGGELPVDNIAGTSLFDMAQDSTQLDVAIPAASGITMDTASEFALNYYVPVASASDVLESTYAVYRNLGEKGEVVRNIASGWAFDVAASEYSALVKVEDPSGYSIDLGVTEATIDGVVRSGVFLITKGLHSFVTSASNWAAVASGLLTEALLDADDGLYPYNHKQIVEGYVYAGAFTGAQVYTGAAWWAEKQVAYLPQHEFASLTDTNNLDVYTRRVDGTGNLAFIVKTVQDFGDHFNERFRTEYSLPSRDFNQIYMKIVLNTSDPSVSPFVDSYTIKLG